MKNVDVSIKALRARGIEVPGRGNPLSGKLSLPVETRIEAPSSLKLTQYEHSLEMGAFSYQVSGYCFGARIGRYCSIGEDVQIGRQNHAMGWLTTSPAFYLPRKMFDVGNDWTHAEAYHAYRAEHEIPHPPPTQAQITHIGHDVWIGHGAYIGAGVDVGTGAVIGAHAVVTKSVPPYAVVAGNPATIIRNRISARYISGMLDSNWWNYAPWQMMHLNLTDPPAFLDGIAKMKGAEIFTPDVIDLTQGLP